MARVEASTQGLDIRYVVTTLPGAAQHFYGTIYCERGQAENLIKLHKAQLASDRTSCHSPAANQVRLVLNTAAYRLMLTRRDAIPAASPLARSSSKSPPASSSTWPASVFICRQGVPGLIHPRRRAPLASRSVTAGARAPLEPIPKNPQPLPSCWPFLPGLRTDREAMLAQPPTKRSRPSCMDRVSSPGKP